MKNFFKKVGTFIKHNWKGATTFVAIIAFIIAVVVICEMYEYAALNIWGKG